MLRYSDGAKQPDKVMVAEVPDVVAPKLLAVCLLVGPTFPGCLALNHSNDATFDVGRSTLCIGTDGEHIIAAVVTTRTSLNSSGSAKPILEIVQCTHLLRRNHKMLYL